MSVKHIDALLISQYPQLGQVSAAAVAGPLGRQVALAYSVMEASPEELRQAQEVLAALHQVALPFDLAALPQALPLPGLGTFWLFTEAEGHWQAHGLDQRRALPFLSEAQARAWVHQKQVDWTGSAVEEQAGEWVYVRLPDGLSVKWPVAEWLPV